MRHALDVLAAADLATIERVMSSPGTDVPAEFFVAVRDTLVHRRATDVLASAMGSLATAVDPATARAVQATENVWRQIDTEFGLLSSSEVGGLLGARGANRTYAADLRKRGELLGAQRKNAYVYPGFQFDHNAGAVRPWVTRLLELADEQKRSAADVVMWMMAPTTYFDGDRPVDHVGDTERLLSVASRSWGIVW
ncbi:hypothetical protein [Microbacterium protaetiae]|uniref:hypothetical protein n=1 Tax=Microbacterium protaetiae TaxID=2509458 RepID=UPI0013EAD368|nr:hypothetical protein [Microbacterium protaetiae]